MRPKDEFQRNDPSNTMERMTTQGRFKAATRAKASEVLPEPELPATPIIPGLAHGGE